MNTRICIGIPTINRADLLKEALQTYAINGWLHRDIWIVDNGNQDIIWQHGLNEWSHAFHVIIQRRNIGVAASWNMICQMAFKNGYTHVLILNDDVIINRTPEELEKWLDAVKMDFYTGRGYYSFIMPESTFKKVGEFDENYYPAYYEDTDYSYRLRINSMRVLDTDLLKPDVLRTSKSGEKDPTLYNNIAQNRDYYTRKWGGEPSKETSKKPLI